MHRQYISSAIRQLRDQQVKYAPRERKLEQADRAERLIAELDPNQVYSFHYLCYRITRFRPESLPDEQIRGGDAIHDLRLLVEDLSDAANVPVDAVGERVLTVEELSRQLNVSTKTISRWRQVGLVSRRFVFDGRKRVGFLESSVRRFIEQNKDRVERGSRFSQLSEEEKQAIIENARRLAVSGRCPSEVIRRLAAETGRSAETIRYTLKNFDEQNPDLAIFPNRSGPLTDDDKQRIYEQYRRGESVEALARRYCRTKTTIYRIIGEVRARRIMQLPLDYVPSPEFENVTPEREAEILGPAPPAAMPPKKPRIPPGLPQYLASLYEVPLLTAEQEVHLFRKMNYLKYKAAKLREKLDPARPKSSLMDQIEKLYEQAVATKNEIISANLRLVVSIAKRHVGPGTNFFELVSDGNMSLIRAVEKFDYTRGNKFSTYASWAIMKNFARTIPEQQRYRERFRSMDQELFGAAEDTRSDPYEMESKQLQREVQVRRILSYLDPREQRVLASRFGLDRSREPLTLKEVGAELGVTKERARQLEARALMKARRALMEEGIEMVEVDD